MESARDDPARSDHVALPYIDCEFVRVPVSCMRCIGAVASSLTLSRSSRPLSRPSGRERTTSLLRVLFPFRCGVLAFVLLRLLCCWRGHGSTLGGSERRAVFTDQGSRKMLCQVPRAIVPHARRRNAVCPFPSVFSFYLYIYTPNKTDSYVVNIV